MDNTFIYDKEKIVRIIQLLNSINLTGIENMARVVEINNILNTPIQKAE